MFAQLQGQINLKAKLQRLWLFHIGVGASSLKSLVRDCVI